MDVIFLGTGAGAPTRKRNVTSIAIRFDQSREVWLFDCGEGTQHQLQRSPISPVQITHLFVTHLHGDHVFGLPGFLSSRSLQGGTDHPLTVVGPPGIRQLLDTIFLVTQTNLNYQIKYQEIDADGVILEHELATVTSRALAHSVKSLGYAIKLPDRPGRFMIEKAQAENIPTGPLYAKLKAGEQIELRDGRRFNGQDFVEPPIPGKKIAIMGDTMPCLATVDLAKDADLLIHEATFTADQSNLAKISGHSTAADAARMAKEAAVRRLILTHISARYQDNLAAVLLAEAKQVFPTTELADDLAQFLV